MADKILQAFMKHLKEAQLTADNPQTAMVKEIFEPGFPEVTREIVRMFVVGTGESSVIVPITGTFPFAGGLTAGDFGATGMIVEYATIGLDDEKGFNLQWNRKYAEDVSWDFYADNLRAAKQGIEFGLWNTLTTLMNANANVTATTLTMTATLVWADIVEGVVALAGYDYKCTHIIVNPVEFGDILQMAQIIDASQFGSDKAVTTGILPTILGFTVISSSRVAAGKVYFIDATKAIGLAMRRDVKAEEYEYPDVDKYGVVLSIRYGAKVLLPRACVLGSK